MSAWLLKSEPSVWSWQDQVKAGEKGTEWTGVRNHSAKRNLMAMQKADQAFFYHSNEGKAIVGIVEIIQIYTPDPTDKTGVFGMVGVRAVKPLPKEVALSMIKAEKRLQKMALVTQSRLSVQPVLKSEWEIICRMGGL